MGIWIPLVAVVAMCSLLPQPASPLPSADAGDIVITSSTVLTAGSEGPFSTSVTNAGAHPIAVAIPSPAARPFVAVSSGTWDGMTWTVVVPARSTEEMTGR